MNKWVKIIVSVSLLSIFLNGCGQPRVPSSQLHYTEIIEHVENKSNAFELSKMWLAYTFNDSKSVIEYTNKENGTLIGKGILKNVYYGTMVNMDTKFTLKIQVKDNKSRLIFSDMIQYPSPGVNMKPFNMWNREAVEQFKVRAKKLVSEYRKMINKKSVNNSDDW